MWQREEAQKWMSVIEDIRQHFSLPLLNMGVGRALDLKFLAKKIVFLVLSRKKQISPLLVPPGKNLKNPLVPPPLEKILPTPMLLKY